MQKSDRLLTRTLSKRGMGGFDGVDSLSPERYHSRPDKVRHAASTRRPAPSPVAGRPLFHILLFALARKRDMSLGTRHAPVVARSAAGGPRRGGAGASAPACLLPPRLPTVVAPQGPPLQWVPPQGLPPQGTVLYPPPGSGATPPMFAQNAAGQPPPPAPGYYGPAYPAVVAGGEAPARLPPTGEAPPPPPPNPQGGEQKKEDGEKKKDGEEKKEEEKEDKEKEGEKPAKPEDFSVHGQMTTVAQGDPPFRARTPDQTASIPRANARKRWRRTCWSGCGSGAAPRFTPTP